MDPSETSKESGAGPSHAVLPIARALARRIGVNGHRRTRYRRGIDPERPDNRDDWVTELQAPLPRAVRPVTREPGQ